VPAQQETPVCLRHSGCKLRGCGRSRYGADWQGKVDPRSLCRKLKCAVYVAAQKLNTCEFTEQVRLLVLQLPLVALQLAPALIERCLKRDVTLILPKDSATTDEDQRCNGY
jgi:hypothetical protein